MNSREFCYWLQGFFELEGKAISSQIPAAEDSLNPQQVGSIRAHLNLVFVHEIDPSAGGPVEQAKLNAVHAGVTKEELDAKLKEAIESIPKPAPFHNPTLRC